MIIVMPDMVTAYFCTWLSESPVLGNWQGFITEDLIDFVDSHYRTIGNQKSRGIAGHSAGGIGAIRLAMTHPDKFGALYILSSGAAMAFFPELVTQVFRSAFIEILNFTSLEETFSASFDAQVLLAFAAAYTPNPDAPLLANLPAELVEGEVQIVDEVWEQWLANDPVRMVLIFSDNLRQLAGIGIDVGDEDPFSLLNQALSDAMLAAGVPHRFEVYSGTHLSHIEERIAEVVLPFFGDMLQTEAPNTAVDAASWGSVKMKSGAELEF